MAYRRGANDLAQREQRERAYASVTPLAKKFPALSELVIELRFTEQNGKPYLSPYRQIFLPDMQAFFAVQCPMKDCVDGGFDLSSAVSGGASRGGAEVAGTARCTGRRPGADGSCGTTLTYKLMFTRHDRATANAG